MRRAPRPHLQLARPSVEFQANRDGGTLEDVLAVVGIRGDREESRRGSRWVLREDPLPAESLSVATRRLLDRLVPLRTRLQDLSRKGFRLRVLVQQAPGEGHVVPAGLFAEAAAWGGRIDVDQFVVVDCGDLDSDEPGIFLDPAAVAAHAATGTDLLVGGFGAPEPRPDPGWVLPWRGRAVRELTVTDDRLHLRLDDRTVLDAVLEPGTLEIAEITELGPREVPVDALRDVHAISSAVLWPDGLRLTGDGPRVQARTSQFQVRGRGFSFSPAGPQFHHASVVLEGWAERGGLSMLWCPSSEVENCDLTVDVDVCDLVLGGLEIPRLWQVLRETMPAGVGAWAFPRNAAPGAQVDDVGAALADPQTRLVIGAPTRASTWGELLGSAVGVVTADDGGIRFTTRADLLDDLLPTLRG